MHRLLCTLLLVAGSGFADEIPIKNGAPVPFRDELLPLTEKEIVRTIRRHILAQAELEAGEKPSHYRCLVPKTGVEFEMRAIPGGEVLMGSPEDEKSRLADEGPQYRARVSPFWMGKREVSWDEFEPFMITGEPRDKNGRLIKQKYADDFAELTSSPTTPYTEMSFGMGTSGYPAINMTHHAASKYCQWLSAQTGHFYRLPTEAEWEFACRAGSTTPYWFGSDEKQLEEWEVIDPEQVRVGYEKVGTSKPNPFGLHDMHGNVMEWCLDQYFPDRKAALRVRYPGVEVFEDPYLPATTRYPRVARGGSWYDPPEVCRSASRCGSEETWMIQDPQLPKSLWYLTDAHWLGFRLVRSSRIPDEDELFDIWNSGNVYKDRSRR